jgi:Sulfotransferase family
VSVAQRPLAWLPLSIAEASLTGKPESDDMDLPQAWSYLLHRLERTAQIVESDPVSRNRVDLAAGMRHLLVLLAAGIDEALRFDPDPILCVRRTSTDDIVTWGMECPDCIYTRATMRGGESYRLFGNRGTARYVGLQTMNGIISTANELVDELEVDADGSFEMVLSADERDGNWMRIEGAHPTLTVRHFFYDWNTEVPSSLRIERLGDPVEARNATVDRDVAVSRQLVALGDFVHGVVRVPSYLAWLMQCDMRETYTFHRRVLKLLQWHCPPVLWHLKTPVHMFALDALVEAYPNAKFIWSHRDPAKVMGSVCSLIRYVRSWSSDRDDPEELGAEQLDSWLGLFGGR